jgi:succinate dehydrogenase/fumarate reductase flavoprotein subunit
VSVPEIDVVVVGAGAAGLAAALEAHERGARVVVAESESVVGGASRLSAGMVIGADTRVQRAAGLQDSPDGLYQEYMLANQYLIKPGIARRLAHESGPAIDWLLDLGVPFFAEPMQGGGERVARSHVPDGGDLPGGQRVIDVLHQRCRERGIEVALGNRVDRLMQREGAVVGVSTGGDEVEARAVVLATGGFGANRSLIAEHLPSLARYGDLVFYIGPESSRGDALTLGRQVGANTVGHDVYVPLLSPRLDTREFGAYMPGWLLLLGPDGRRVCDETAPYGQTYALVRAAGEVVYGVFDARTLADNETPGLPTFKPKFPEGSGGPPNIWTADAVQRYVDSGAMVQAQTLADLATGLGLAEPAVAGAIARYNEFARAGEDRDFGKPAAFLRTVETPPIYGVEIRPSTLGITCYGLEIDDQAHVLDPCSNEVQGLFAAGECAGGVLGTRYAGSGNSWANCLVFGRVAGRSAADYALSDGHAAGELPAHAV